MHVIYLFCILVFGLVSQARPIWLGSKVSSSIQNSNNNNNNKTLASSVSQAVDGLSQNAATVSQELNALPLKTDKKQIQDSARKALDAEIDQDSHRFVLAKAAGSAGSSSSDRISEFMPTILNGLNAIIQSGTTKSIMENVPAIPGAVFTLTFNTSGRNSKILPSIMQLTMAALDTLGVNSVAQAPLPTGRKDSIKDNNNHKFLKNYKNSINNNATQHDSNYSINREDRMYNTNQKDRNDNNNEGDRNCLNQNDSDCNTNQNENSDNFYQNDRNNDNRNNENWNSNREDGYNINQDNRNNKNRKDRNNTAFQNDWNNAHQEDWNHANQDDWNASQGDWKNGNRNENQNTRNIDRNSQ